MSDLEFSCISIFEGDIFGTLPMSNFLSTENKTEIKIHNQITKIN